MGPVMQRTPGWTRRVARRGRQYLLAHVATLDVRRGVCASPGRRAAVGVACAGAVGEPDVITARPSAVAAWAAPAVEPGHRRTGCSYARSRPAAVTRGYSGPASAGSGGDSRC